MLGLQSLALTLYGKAMYLRWLYSHYDHVGRLISLMDSDLKGLRVLDVGSGQGNIASDSRLKGADITCVDSDVSAVKECKKRGLHSVQIDVREIPKRFSKEEFEIVWCLDILEHLEKSEALKLLEDLERICQKKLIVFIPLGYLPQDRDPQGSFDSELVKHRSTWEKKDFLERGYRCQVLKGFHWDIRMYCSSLEDIPYPIVRDAMWAVKEVEYA